jgi:hypothetical protein
MELSYGWWSPPVEKLWSITVYDPFGMKQFLKHYSFCTHVTWIKILNLCRFYRNSALRISCLSQEHLCRTVSKSYGMFSFSLCRTVIVQFFGGYFQFICNLTQQFVTI